MIDGMMADWKHDKVFVMMGEVLLSSPLYGDGFDFVELER